MPRTPEGVQSVEAEGFEQGMGNGDWGLGEAQSGSFAMILSLCITPKRPWGGHLGYQHPAETDKSGPKQRIRAGGIHPDQPFDPRPSLNRSAGTGSHPGRTERQDGPPERVKYRLTHGPCGKRHPGQHQ